MQAFARKNAPEDAFFLLVYQYCADEVSELTDERG